MTFAAGASTIELRLERAAVMAGHVLGAAAEPIVNARVYVNRVQADPNARSAPVASVPTDDTGEYRVAALEPGRYRVAVMTSSTVAGRMNDRGGIAFQPEVHTTYFPNAAERSDAEIITLAAGEERADIDIAVPGEQTGGESFGMRGTAARAVPPTGSGVIRGRVTASDGRALAHARVMLMSDRDPLPQQAIATDGRGQFEFTAPAPDTYRVVATKPGFAAADAMNDPQPLFAFLRTGQTVALRDGDAETSHLLSSHDGRVVAVFGAGRVVQRPAFEHRDQDSEKTVGDAA